MVRAKRERPRYRLYTRPGADGLNHFYADFRGLGGGREALIPHAEHRATIDRDVAERIAAARAVQLVEQKHRHERVAAGVEQRSAPGLKAFAIHHLEEKAKAGRVTTDWLFRTEEKLKVAVEYFGADMPLDQIGVSELSGFLVWLQERRGRRGNNSLSGGTQRHYLNALSNLYRRAQAENIVPPGYNPVAAMLEKPVAKRQEARWLEVHDAALLLEAARTYTPYDASRTLGYMHALIATFLLTGGRMMEVLGLQVADVNFERRTVTFRENEYRRLKTLTSARVVPLWPQLEVILRAHIRDLRIAGGCCFRRLPVEGAW